MVVVEGPLDLWVWRRREDDTCEKDTCVRVMAMSVAIMLQYPGDPLPVAFVFYFLRVARLSEQQRFPRPLQSTDGDAATSRCYDARGVLGGWCFG